MSWAIDRFVDPALSTGNGTTLFTTINSAVSAAVDGDRILIVAGNYNEPTLTIGKSLTLLSQTAGSSINYNGNIVIAGFPGMKLEILGFNLGVYSFSSNAISGGAPANRAKISIIDCKMADLNNDQNYYELNCIKCVLTGTITFRYGGFFAGKSNNLNVTDEPNQNQSGSRILIIADTIIGNLEFRNNDFPATISNCLLKNLYLWHWNYLSTNTNKITNNEFQSSYIFIPTIGVPGYNFEISSNIFTGTTNFYNGSPTCASCTGGCCGAPAPTCTPGYYNGTFTITTCNIFVSWSTTSSAFPNPSVPGFFRWTYNGIDLPCTIPTGSQPLVLTKIIGPVGVSIDAGNPNHDYYDIDLTLNDRGVTGGPYSIYNYNPSFNPSNGKAFIFDLELPADLFSGQQVDIKAKGYHKN